MRAPMVSLHLFATFHPGPRDGCSPQTACTPTLLNVARRGFYSGFNQIHKFVIMAVYENKTLCLHECRQGALLTQNIPEDHTWPYHPGNGYKQAHSCSVFDCYFPHLNTCGLELQAKKGITACPERAVDRLDAYKQLPFSIFDRLIESKFPNLTDREIRSVAAQWTFRPAPHVIARAEQRRAEMGLNASEPYLSVHIRRGDHSSQAPYTPTNQYVQALTRMKAAANVSSGQLYVATDGPDSLAKLRAQSRGGANFEPKFGPPRSHGSPPHGIPEVRGRGVGGFSCMRTCTVPPTHKQNICPLGWHCAL